LKILFAYTLPFHPERGGIERVTHSLASVFSIEGYEIWYLHRKLTCEEKQFKYPAIIAEFPEQDLFSNANYLFYNELVKKEQFDIIINQAGAVEECTFFLNLNIPERTKLITVIHSKPLLGINAFKYIFRPENNDIMSFLKNQLKILLIPHFKRKFIKARTKHFSTIIEKSNKVVCLSDGYMNEIRNLFSNKNLTNLYSIPNPNSFIIDENQIPRNKKKEVLFVGRLTFGDKRADRLLRIWTKVQPIAEDWKLIIVGDGPERNKLMDMAKRMNLKNYSFEGFKPSNEFMQTASILCMTSNFEGFPMVLTEAMQHKVVPMAFNSFAACADIIQNKHNGIYIPPFDIDAYANELIGLIENDFLRNKLAANAFKDVQRFDIRNIFELWNECLTN